MLFHYWPHVVNSKHDGNIIITTGSTVKKSVTRRRGRLQQPLREMNDEHSLMEDLSPAKKHTNALHKNRVIK